MANEFYTTTASHDRPTQLPSSIRVITLNCWGLKYISKHRHARLEEIGRQLAIASPAPSIVGLQECWTQQDYLKIRELTRSILPYGKFYFSGTLGGGLAILSKWPIEESSMFRFPLNGKPAAVHKGDWYVGKGVGRARIRIGPDAKDVVEVFCTHLYAPNEGPLNSRVAQAWEVARLMRHAAERGHMVLGLGDFNSVPLSLVHRIVEAHSPVRDIWRIVKPGSATKLTRDVDGGSAPSAKICLEEHGITADSNLNTWRWSKKMQKGLSKGEDVDMDAEAPDPGAKRLDYIFFYDNATHEGERWSIEDIQVGMTMRHPTLRCSLSDHFSVEATLTRRKGQPGKTVQSAMTTFLPLETYDEILALITQTEEKEKRQRRFQLTHFFASTAISIGCFIAVWWSPTNYVSFILTLISTIGLGAGIIDGLMGFIFIGTELRALREFRWEITNAREQAKAASQ